MSQKGRHLLRKGARIAIVAFAVEALLTVAAPSVVLPVFAHAEAQTPVTEEEIAGKPFCVSRQVIHARPEQVWQVLTDYANAPRVFPMMKKCDVIEDHGSNKVVRHEVVPSGPCGSFEYILALKESAPKALEWHRIKGDFKEVDGFWKLEPLDNGHSTLVTYSSHVNGGLFIPQILIKRQCKTDMPIVMSCLKKQAETGAKIAERPGSTRSQ
jgi:ribosome-associated toxin RatA of RatAB toxin-antitoxin module